MISNKQINLSVIIDWHYFLESTSIVSIFLLKFLQSQTLFIV